MAVSALEHGVVIGIRMARGANTVGVAMVNWESRVLRVIERRTSPGGRGMAGRASGREELRLRGMAGVGGVVVIGLMAADTGRGQRSVVAVDMAVSAYPRWCLVRAGQGECRVVVIERGICPHSSVMAEFAGLSGIRPSRGPDWWYPCNLSGQPIARCAVERVVAVDVAIGAQARRNR